VRVIECRQNACLALEPRATIRVAREVRGQQLHCDLTTELLVASAVDFPHPTRTDWRQDGIGSKPPADQRPLTGEVTGHIRSRERWRFQKCTGSLLVRQ